MEKRNETIVSRNGKELRISKILNADRDLVWRVWTEPEHIGQWFGPDGFTITNKGMDVKTGGEWLFTMHGFGQDFPNRMVFTEVIKPERIVYIHTNDDDTNNITFHVIVTFEELGEQTKVTMNSVFATAEALDKVNEENNAIEGGRQHINRLAVYLEKVK